MSTRPEPRRSSLAGASPITSPPASTDDRRRDTGETPETPRNATSGNTEEDPSQPRRRRYPAKVSFYQDRADTDRVRGALLHTMVQEGPRTMSQFIHHAVMNEVHRLEATYNNGKPFPPIGPRTLPQGRPFDSTQ